MWGSRNDEMASFSALHCLLSFTLTTKPGVSPSRHKTSIALVIIYHRLLWACNFVPTLSHLISCGGQNVPPCLSLHEESLTTKGLAMAWGPSSE